MSCEDVANAAPILGGRISDLRRLSRMAASDVPEAPLPEIALKSTADFPVAPYPNVSWDWLIEGFSDEDDITGNDSGSGSGNCNFANSPSADKLYAFQTIQTIVDAIAAVASRICNQFGSAVIAGVNLSSLCIVTDIGAVVARAFNGNWNNCSDWIMAAEVTGTYERLDHVHTDIADAETALTAEIDANETKLIDLASDLVAHDQNLSAQMDEIDLALGDQRQFLESFRASMLQLDVEMHLAETSTRPISSLGSPAAAAGYLESVGDVVETAMANMLAAGERIGRAQRYFDDAEAAAAAGDYAAALDLYDRSYREVVK